MTTTEAYLLSQVRSATPCGLVIMLHDGLIRFASEASEAMQLENSGRSVRAATAIDHCIRILTELNTSLRFDVDPELCGTLSNLYAFFTQELSRALHENTPEPISRMIHLVQELRATWCQVEMRNATPPALARQEAILAPA